MSENIYTDLLGVTGGSTAAGALGAIGTGFLTPAQGEFMATRTRYGGVDDPNVGTFHLSRIVWDKETGDASFGMLSPMADGWYGGAGSDVTPDQPGEVPCGCEGCGSC